MGWGARNRQFYQEYADKNRHIDPHFGHSGKWFRGILNPKASGAIELEIPISVNGNWEIVAYERHRVARLIEMFRVREAGDFSPEHVAKWGNDRSKSTNATAKIRSDHACG